MKRGCRLSNTTPQSIHTPLINHPNCQVSGGLDWFEWSAQVVWDQSCFSLIFDQLQQLKEECQQENKPEKLTYLLGTVPVWVSRMGKSRGRHFPFHISVGGIKITLGDWQAGADKQENLTVLLTGRDCLLHGGWESYQFVCSVVESLFGEIIDEKLTRVDFCLDIANFPVEQLQSLVEKHHFITRLKEVRPQVNLVGNQHTGFTAGKRPQRLIVYDKLAEIRHKVDQEYVQALIDNRYGGQIPDQATRIELQFSRDYLKRMGISRPTDIVKHAPSAIRRFMTETFRMTDRAIVPGTKNHSRAEIHPLWNSLIEAYERIYGVPLKPSIPIQRSEVNPQQLLKQSVGCFKNIFLQQGKGITSYSEFIQLVSEELKKLYPTFEQQDNFVEEYLFRLTEHIR
ncbi:hypothetical protein MNBD_PLANCTO02-3402 [hydrothermal vent metagenome]|uniref:Replication protein n=1 Tax=hydrothermal vent metagenome TaxID=652676 RepID=A0A3B1DP75_9ZZZZ